MKLWMVMATLLCTACAGNESMNTEPSFSIQSSEEAVSCGLSAEQQDMLDAVNQARSSATLCGDELKPAVRVLSWNCSLEDAAELHSQDMGRYEFFEHTGSDGLLAGDRIQVQGYQPLVWAENIAEGYDSVQDVVQEWLESPAHCENIMNGKVDEMGAGAARSSNGVRYWTQLFAASFNP